MPRRALVFITALVLALHWLVLSGVPLAWDSPAQPSRQVFSTRSIAPAPPPPTVAPPGVTAVPVAAPQPAPRKKALSPKRPPAPAAQDRPEPAPAAAPVAEAEAPSDTGAATTVASATPEAPANDAAPAPAPAASAPAAPAEPATEDTQTGTGVDIRPPGGTGRSASAPPPPVRMPAPTRLAFDVSGQAKKFAYSARAELLWQHDGNRYEARQEISAFLVGTRMQRSVGTVTEQGLLPEKFSDKSRSEQAAHFDYAKGRVTFSANTPEAAAGPGVQDRLSLFIQLGAMLAADPGRFVPGTQITLTTVSARSADRWTFTVEGPETLDLPAGSTPALKLLRLPRKDYDQKAELWVAPGLGYLPVRIKLTQANGDFADLLLRASGPP
ncbi:MAG: hypothetical protein ABS39_15050 [Acidovorax sp. SCN 65-28]|uniref:DUF3108 domain-containing protein n=1 Tax=Acidovorax sp. TaxID=1872122 RepID=UPI000869FD62|nr:DUF3108 domain-containing protein [Acidovorax sp.]MBN9625308.1 DUF3108 domain-containing protein [Acidovorax sp.]ODS72892.1 MAG: hypothetical protein ABS39_15050 [Acidovorax sp. SCN 65-28]OJT98509.1 MAG: hypothetical protein BGN90_11345 [Acidovorax sp. 65-7]